MKAEISTESYALVLKMAYKFAYGNESIKYEEYVNAGLEGLKKAVDTFKEGQGADFATYANTCIRNKMCTKQTQQNKFDLVQDENVIMDNIDTMLDEMVDDNMEEITRMAVMKANNNDERNAQMFLLHIGLGGEKKLDYKEIGLKFNVSAERVRQICVKTQKTLKADKNAKAILYSFVG